MSKSCFGIVTLWLTCCLVPVFGGDALPVGGGATGAAPTGELPRPLPPLVRVDAADRATASDEFPLQPVAFQQPAQPQTAAPQPPQAAVVQPSGQNVSENVDRFLAPQFESSATASAANNFNAFPQFDSGIVISGEEAALKVGGYVKADLIKDFDAIDSTDSFATTAILTDGQQRENTRFHARQSRLSFDTRWLNRGNVVRAFVEADFFGAGTGGSADLRLRHAYGTLGRVTAGQTWTTFTDAAAVPQTLDFEGAVSNVNRRQGQIRWTQPILFEGLSLAMALENPQIILELPPGITGEGRTQTPDLIARLRFERDWGSFQGAYLLRELAFQPTGQRVVAGTASGFNFTGSLIFAEATRGYYQITWGEGIGSYRGTPDVVATGPNTAAVLPVFGWMVGLKHAWTDRLSSNFTYSELSLDNLPGQDPGNLSGTTYLAVNLIANPYERVFCGIEYLHGIREDVGGAEGSADRLQMSFGFYLP